MEDLVTSHQLQSLTPRHKQAMALLAQGVDRSTIGQVCDFAPEYVSWLARQEICREYLREMQVFSEAQLSALFSQSVDVIREVLQTGSEDGRLKAAKLQMEATGRLGARVAPPESQPDDRLERLGERLLKLLKVNQERVLDVQTVEVIQE